MRRELSRIKDSDGKPNGQYSPLLRVRKVVKLGGWGVRNLVGKQGRTAGGNLRVL